MQISSPCRHCDSTGHHLSRMRPFDWLLYPLGYVPVRCKNCGNRTYQRRGPWDRKHAEHEESSKLNET